MPTRFAGQLVTMKAYPDRVCLYHGAELIARHGRSFERHLDIEDPDHPKALVAQRRHARDSQVLSRFLALTPLEEAIARYGSPEIFNTDHGSQFTSAEFTSVLKEHGIRISMDGKGCWRDNVFVERLWRTVKYEEVYLKAYDTVSTAKANLATFFNLETSVGRTRRRLWRGGWLGATRQHGRSLQRGATTPDAPPEPHSGT